MNEEKTLDELANDMWDSARCGFRGQFDSVRDALIVKAQESQREKIALHAESFKWTQNHPSAALYEFAQAIRGTG